MTPTTTEAQTGFAQQLARIKRDHPQPEPERNAPDWLNRTVGMFDDDPTWDDFARFMEEESQRDREATIREYEEQERTARQQ